MNIIHVATIRSLVHHQVKGPLIIGDEGFWEHEVHVDIDRAGGDVKGYIVAQIGTALVGCAKSTTVPMGEDLWIVQYSPWMQEHLNAGQGFSV